MQVPEAAEPDSEKAARFKRQGDEAFVSRDFEGAKRAYSQSIQHGTGDPLVWANRSAACLRLHDYQSAYHDARISRVLHPTYVKASLLHEPSACPAKVRMISGVLQEALYQNRHHSHSVGTHYSASCSCQCLQQSMEAINFIMGRA